MASHEHGEHHSHILLYSIVLGVLLVLTAITVFIAQFDFGVMNLVVAMVVASFKATLVGLVFMHLRYENPLIWLYVIFPILLLAIMLGGIFIDNPLRFVP